MALEGKMVDAAPTAAERRMIMAKYIDREALVEWLKRIPLTDLSDGRGLCRVIFEDDFKRAIKKIPKGIIVDVAPVRHGRWLDRPKNQGLKDEEIGTVGMVDGEPWSSCYCSECGEWLVASDEYPVKGNYCPNCGAKMNGGRDQ